MTDKTEIDPALMRKLMFPDNPNQRITNEALETAGFLLRQFIIEARDRACVEVCTHVGWLHQKGLARIWKELFTPTLLVSPDPPSFVRQNLRWRA